MVSLADKLEFLFPNITFSPYTDEGGCVLVSENGEETIYYWPPHLGPQPTPEELDAVAEAVAAQKAATQYQRDRLTAYRAAFDVDQVQEAMFEYMAGKPEKYERLEAMRQAIKAKFPKPTP